MMKLRSLFLTAGLLFTPFTVFGDTVEEAQDIYKAELISIGKTEEYAEMKAADDIEAVVSSMESAQSDLDVAYEALNERVDSLNKNDSRLDRAKSALSKAEDLVSDFKGIDSSEELDVQLAVAGGLPRVLPSAGFELAQEEAETAMSDVNRVLIAPVRPGTVPEGDLVSDFLPQLIRQLFRFASLVILISFVGSGVLLVLAQEDEERITKAKGMIYYSFIGFAFISLAFAIVKAITDIDFFRFI